MASVNFPIAVGGDGSTVSDDKNPLTGLAGGGYLKRLIPALSNVVNIASYVSSVATGLPNIGFVPVRGVTTSNDTLSGLAARNGITPVAGDRWLVTGQTTGSQNGIYIAASGAWARATDADTSAEFARGKTVVVMEGAFADTIWIHTTDGTITLGTTSLTFERLPSLSKNNTWSGEQTFSDDIFIDGAIIEREATVSASGSPNIWVANTIKVTGNGSVSDFADAPRAGLSRILYMQDSPSFSDGFGITVAGGGSFNASHGDMALVIATSTTSFLLIPLRINGYPATNQLYNFNLPSARLSSIQLLDGKIPFPATQIPSAGANDLDDYEEGTWTPVGGSGSSLTVVSGSAKYIKIGRFVYLQAHITMGTQTNASQFEIAGIPFSTNSGGETCAAGNISNCTESTLSSLMVAGSSIYGYTSSGGNVTITAMSGDTVRFSATYLSID